tara:strand:+ start:19464 stop:19688 length:225 start_codon:yes stop_codon:yes gene_type:complete
MKPTQYVSRKSEMTDIAKSFAKKHPENWYIKTTLECDHKVNERRKGVFLVTAEKLVQRVIVCGTCKPKTETNEQ